MSAWRRLTPEVALATFDLLTPGRREGPVWFLQQAGFSLWCYRVERHEAFARGQSFLYWIRRDRDQLEWYGSGPRLGDCQADAQERLVALLTSHP